MRVHANTDGKVAASTTAAGFVTPEDAQDLDALDGLVGLADVVRRHYGRPLQVLLVIDDTEAAEAFAVAAEESVLEVGIEVVVSADDALARISRLLAARRRRSIPDVVVCALPIEESHSLLDALRPQTEADAFPVIVLSDETGAALERRSFALGAAGHMRSPDRQYERVALIHALPDFLPQVRDATDL